MTTFDREAIATLVGQRPYMLLLEELEESIHEMLGELVMAKSDEETLKISRLWQVFYRYFTILKTRPQHIRVELNNEIEELKKSSRYLPTDPHAPPFSQERAEMLERIEDLAHSPTPERYDFS